MDKSEQSEGCTGQVKGTLVVNGVGSVQAQPDMAQISLGVLTTAKTAQDAVRENARLMEQIITRIKALGVPPEDLQTTDLSITPTVDEDERSPTRGQIVGYRVEDTLHIKADIAKAAAAVDAGIEAGANQGSGLLFGLRDPAPYQRLALEEAIQAAQRDAERISAWTGVALRGLQTLDVSYGGVPSSQLGYVRVKTTGLPMEAGSLAISATARLCYATSTADIPRYLNPTVPILARCGDLFAVGLRANHTTPYRWRLVSKLNDTPLSFLGTSYLTEPAPASRPPLVGQGGMEVWLFKATSAAVTALTFQYVSAIEAPARATETDAKVSFQVIIERAP